MGVSRRTLLAVASAAPPVLASAKADRTPGAPLPVEILFFFHSISTDNEHGIATGWNEGELSDQGKALARRLGETAQRRQVAAVFSSDLGRAAQTSAIAFANSDIPIFFDSRLRECNYGAWNGQPAARVHADRVRFIRERYPEGESYGDVVTRVAGFLESLAQRCGGKQVAVTGHGGTGWALNHLLKGVPLERLANAPSFPCCEKWDNDGKGWDYVLPGGWRPAVRP